MTATHVRLDASASSSLLIKLLFLSTTFAFACLCYYTTTFPAHLNVRNGIGAPVTRGAPNALVLANAAKKLPPRTTADTRATDDNNNNDDVPVVLAQDPTIAPEVIAVVPSQEELPMGESFYTSNFDDAQGMSTTIIFNVFKGEPKALELQLTAAAQQEKLTSAPHVWVTCFDSPRQHEFERVVAKFRDGDDALLPNLVFTVSNFNHKFHGRFLLAYMATTKYVLIVDDDKMIDSTTVYDYIQLMTQTPGVWGNFGHLRAPTFGGYKSWPNVGYDTSVQDMAEQDYLSGMWFIQQSWLEYFVKERPPTWETSEDMHLSHVLRKYLNLNTYGGKVALNVEKLPSKKHAATVGSALELREFVFDHQLGRGNKVANVVVPLKTLVYAETVDDIEDLMAKMAQCPGAPDTTEDDGTVRQPLLRTADDATDLDTAPIVEDDGELPPWCTAGKTAVVFRGAAEQDVAGLVAAADALCSLTNCEYVSLKPKISHPVRHFNMREGFGQRGTDIPWQTGVSDVLTSLVGVLNNVLPQQFLFPDVEDVRWQEPSESDEMPDPRDGASRNRVPAKKNRLQIYHNAVRLALQIHANAPTNFKWDHRDLATDPETAFPSDMRVFTWRKTPELDDATEQGEGNRANRDGDENDDAMVSAPLYQEFSFE